jgi:chromosome segregation ATPase
MKKINNSHNPDSKDEYIKELEKKLKDQEKTIESLKEKLSNNQDMLKDTINEKNELKKKIQEYDLKMVDKKLNQYQELHEEQQKTLHRIHVTKNHLDDANSKNKELLIIKEEMQKVLEDLENRGLLDYIRGKYPESYLKYKEK